MRFVITAASALLVPQLLRAAPLQARFELERPLEEAVPAGLQGRVVIPDDVYGQCRSFPSDLRIIGRDGVQWPSFLFNPQRTGESRSVALTVLNRTWVEGAAPYLQFEVDIPEADGKPPVHNRIELLTSGSEFVRRVEVHSAEPPAGFMASGYLIEFANRRDAGSRIIRYPDSDLSRLRIRVYPNARAAAETFQLSGVYLHCQTDEEPEREPVRFTELPLDGRDRDEQAQVYVLDIGQTGRPVEFLTFDIAGTSYARCVSIFGRNSGHEAWRRMGGGEIHALADERSDTVKLNAAVRYLKVQLFHYDDMPLEVRSIRLEAVPRYLVFESASGGAAALYFRGWDIAPPRYDLKSRINREILDELPVFGTSETRPNAWAKAHPWRKYSRILAGLAVGGVSLLVVWIIAGMIRHQSPADPA